MKLHWLLRAFLWALSPRVGGGRVAGFADAVSHLPDAVSDHGGMEDYLAVNRANPSSIAYAVLSARENARRAREIVSTELWETLNTTNSRMPRRISG